MLNRVDLVAQSYLKVHVGIKIKRVTGDAVENNFADR
jgi:hypothetical protein